MNLKKSVEKHKIALCAAERLKTVVADSSCHIEPVLWSIAAKIQKSQPLAKATLEHPKLQVAFPLCCSALSSRKFNTC